jgi:hypothetical protein
MAKQPQKISARDRRALTRLAMQGMRDPSTLTFGQMRRLATVVYKQMEAATAVAKGRGPQSRRRG